MTNRERYKKAFGVLHTSGELSLEVTMKQKHAWRPTRRLIIVCICTVLILGLGVTAYAYGEQTIRKIFGWEQNMEITTTVDENGRESATTIVHTSDLTDPVEIQDGRMVFLVNGEHLDITNQVSEAKGFHYEYTDEDGNTHVWLVGLNSGALDNYGYAEYIRDANGMWAGGYSARVNIESDGTTSAQWLNTAKSELNIPW